MGRHSICLLWATTKASKAPQASSAQGETPQATAPSAATPVEALVDAPPNSFVDVRLDRIDTHIQHIEDMFNISGKFASSSICKYVP